MKGIVPIAVILLVMFTLIFPPFAFSMDLNSQEELNSGPVSIKRLVLNPVPKSLDPFNKVWEEKDPNFGTTREIARVIERITPDPVSVSAISAPPVTSPPVHSVKSVTPRPLPDRLVVIDKTRFKLTLYDKKQPIKTYPVAVGMPGKNTPEGKFYITNKVINPAYGGRYGEPAAGGASNNPLGVRWLGLSIGQVYGIHGTNEPGSIGSASSHGCIRMLNKDVVEFFDLVSRGTPVWIGKESTLANWGIK